MSSRYLIAMLCSLSLLHCSNDEQSLGGNAGNAGAGTAGAGNAGTGNAGTGNAGQNAGGASAGSSGSAGGGAGGQGKVIADKIDLVLMIDNSASMADKQKILRDAVPDLIDRLVTPTCLRSNPDGTTTTMSRDAGGQCPAGSTPEFNAINDIHIGVVTSSLGGHGADICLDVDPAAPDQTSQNNFTRNDHGHLITRGGRTTPAIAFPKASTYEEEGFLAWDPTGTKNTPPGENDASNLKTNFQDIVLGADQIGCGYESQLESWYRFLVDPTPPLTVRAPDLAGAKTVEAIYAAGPAVVDGIDEVLLKQRADFLRPDSLVSVIMLTDENDCSIIDGALPGDVCDSPVLDSAGKPTGACNGARKGWPAGYGVEDNMQSFTKDAEGRVSGEPFAINYIVGQQRLNGANFNMRSGTSACATDPSSPDCQSCFANPQGPGCKPLDSTTDTPQLRCLDQRRRFGVDARYPVGRYVQGLTQPRVYDRAGNLVTNPLFTDLPYQAAQAAGTPLARPEAAPRDARLVYLTGIIGVPWQDIARDPTDLTKGYLPGVPAGNDPKSINWDLLAGDPSVRDPLMLETNQVRSGKNVLGETVSETSWNTINGHEWEPGDLDLQYACVFQLPTSTDCSTGSTSCDCQDSVQPQKNPLCEQPVAGDPTGKGDGVSTTTQFRAKAYPGLRYMPVLQQMKENGIVASICAPNVMDASRSDYGYRPAVASLIDHLKPRLTP